MHKIIDSRREALAALCRRYDVRRLEVFGSVTSVQFDPGGSDIDFLVDFEPNAAGSLFHRYFGLHEALASLFGRKVDLVMVGALRNPYFIESVNRSRELVYEGTIAQTA